MINKALVRAEALTWLGTPFVQGASVKKIGVDCAGLIEGVADALQLALPSRDDGIEAALQSPIFAVLSTDAAMQEADIAVFSAGFFDARQSAATRHMGWILAQDGGHILLHAHWQKGVCCNRFGPFFRKHLTAILRHRDIV